MSLARSPRVLLAAATLGGLVLPAAAFALPQVSGPISIEAARGDGDVQNRSATLTATITNQGSLPDRLVRATCPGYGGVTFANAQASQRPGEPPGLDLPRAAGGRELPVQAEFRLTGAAQPVDAGGLVPCALYFQHGGERVVVFSLGAHEPLAEEP